MVLEYGYIGIAFGMNSQKQTIGQVLISRQLRLYDLQRIGAETTILRGDRPTSTSRVLRYFDSFRQASWKGVTVSPGLLLSGEKLVDNLEYRNQLHALEPEAIGGEMEGAGLYAACHERKVDWIVIKAICDWADGNKADDKELRQKSAAGNAAEFFVAALRHAPLRVGAPIEAEGISAAELDKSTITDLVIAIPGIRTHAEWKEEVQYAIEFQELDPKTNFKLELVRYGYFDLLRFAVPFLFIRGLARNVHDQIENWMREYPNATRVSVIAHSFGTYIIGWILTTTSLRLHRLILCASVIPQDLRWWSVIRKSVDQNVRNDCSRRDIWPALAHALWFYGNSGNQGAPGSGIIDVFHSFSNHSEFVTGKFAFTFWRPFLVTGALISADPQPASERAPWYICRLPVLLRAGQILCVLAAVIWFVFAPTRLREIPPGQIGVMNSWGYSLDSNEAVLSVKSSKVPGVVGRKYVFVVAKNPGGNPDWTKIRDTVVSPIQEFPSADAYTKECRIPCPRLADSIRYGDNVMFLAFVVKDNCIDKLQDAIDDQDNHPLTISQIKNDFGGVKVGGGSDGATYDDNNENLKEIVKTINSGVVKGFVYILDSDEAVVTVSGAKVRRVVGRKYVVVVAKNPGGNPDIAALKGISVSEMQTFPDSDEESSPLRVSCTALAKAIQYRENVLCHVYVVEDSKCIDLQGAIDDQTVHPLTIRKIIEEFGGVKVGSGFASATFDRDGAIIKAAVRTLKTQRGEIGGEAR